jgi:hypothetical protein
MMIPKFKLDVSSGLEQIVRSLQRLNANYELGLSLFQQLPSAAVWSVSNCILTAVEREEGLTELELRPPGLMPPSDDAGRTWNEIGQLFNEIGWISGFTPILIDDQSTFLNRFFELVKIAESSEAEEFGEDERRALEKDKERVEVYLAEHERVINMTPVERATLWLEGLDKTGTPVLSELEHGILEVYRDLEDAGLEISDERIAARLTVEKGIRNKKGDPYTLRWIREVRQRLIAKGYDLRV